MATIKQPERQITINVKKVANNGISIIADWSEPNHSTNSMLYMENAYSVENNKITLDPLLIKILETRYCINSNEVLNCLINNVSYALVPNENFDLILKKYPNAKWAFDSWIPNTRNHLHRELRFPYSIAIPDGNKGWNMFYFGKDEVEKFDKTRGEKEVSIFLDDLEDKYNFKNWVLQHNISLDCYVLLDRNENIVKTCSKDIKITNDKHRLVQVQ